VSKRPVVRGTVVSSDQRSAVRPWVRVGGPRQRSWVRVGGPRQRSWVRVGGPRQRSWVRIGGVPTVRWYPTPLRGSKVG